jgi:hypothetical protein
MPSLPEQLRALIASWRDQAKRGNPSFDLHDAYVRCANQLEGVLVEAADDPEIDIPMDGE